MKAWKNKLALGFMIVVLLLSLTLGAAVWYFGNAYEQTALVYVKSLDWVVP